VELLTLSAVIDRFPDHGQSEAIIAFDKREADVWSFGRLTAEISQLAQALTAMLEPGEAVALFGPTSKEWIVAALAAIRAGAIALPIDVQTDDEGIAHILADSGARHIFTTVKHAERLMKLGKPRHVKPILFEELARFELDRPVLENRELPDLQPQDRAALFYTSGTTGKPKGVPLTHANLCYQIETIARQELVTAADRVLLPLPLHHVYPFVVGMLAPLALGLPIVLPHALTGPQVARALREGRVTVMIGVPRMYGAMLSGIEARAASAGLAAKVMYRSALAICRLLRRLLRLRTGRWLLWPLHNQFGRALRVVASGGALLEHDLALSLEAVGWQVAIGYGLTETSPLLTINPPGKARLGTVGRLIPGTNLRIEPSDPRGKNKESQIDGQPLGEIVVRGPGVFSGYLDLPKETKAAFTKDGWFRTGDLGYLDRDEYLHVVGRLSTQLKTQGGEKVQPDDLEKILAQSDAIREIGVLEDGGKLVALVVPAETSGDKDRGEGDEREQIQKALEAQARRLSSHQRIADFRLTSDPLPRTRLGKIRRQELIERYRQADKSGDAGKRRAGRKPIGVEEMTADDQSLLEDSAAAQVWQLLARRFADKRLTPDSNLQLELGIDSLEWMNLTLDIAQQAGIELDEEALAGVETVRDLLRLVTESTGEGTDTRLDDVFARPEQFIDPRQRKWLKPLGPVQRAIASAGYAANHWLARRWFDLAVHGREHLPPLPPYILTPNHASYLDPIMLAASLTGPRLARLWWTAWTGVTFANPLLRMISRLTHTVPIEPHHGARTSLALAAAILKRGDSLVWFPEGGLTPDGKVQPFKPGLGVLLEHFDVPLVPVFIHGTFEAMPSGARWPHRHRVEVTFGRAVDRAELLHEGVGKLPEERIMDALHARVKELGEKGVCQQA
jgi:long-chain acyl-CoA synthetase